MEKQLPTINDDATVKAYLSMLFDNGKNNEYNEAKELLNYIEQMENQYNEILNELHDVKEILNNFQNPTTKSKLSQAVEKLEEIIDEGINKLNDVKVKLIGTMKSAIGDFKQKGKSGVIKTINVLKFKEALRSVRKASFIALKRTENLSRTCDEVSSEFRKAKTHFKTIGSLLTGKKWTTGQMDIQKLTIMQRGVRSIHGHLENMVIRTTSLLHKLESYEKKSIKSEIKYLENRIDNSHTKRKKKIKIR